jgi:signal transduction histidine kinase
MKKVFLCLFFLFFVTGAFGQANSKLDSLKRVLAKLPVEGKSFVGDTLRVNVLCEMGDEYAKQKSDSILYYRKEALNASIKANYKEGKVKSYILLGNYYSSQSLSIKGTENYLKALAIAEELNLIDEQIKLTAEIGYDYMALNDFKQSYIYFKKHSELCKKHGTDEDYALSINNIGVLYFDQSNYQEALKYFLECEAWSEKTSNPKLINAGLINVGKVYFELGKYSEALVRYKRSLKIEDGYLDKKAFVHNEIANIYLKKKVFNKALSNAKIALANTNFPNKTMLKNVSLNLSKIYEGLGNEKLALKHYKVYTNISLNQDSVKNSQLVRFMNLDYQSEKQLFKIEGLNTEVKIKENQNRLLIFSVIGALVIMFGSLFFYFSIRKKNKFIENQKSEIQDLNQNLEHKIKERTEELSEANKELIKKNFEITEALFKGKTMERERVAAELHDNLGSTLTALKWRLSALDSDQLKPSERKIYDSIKESMNDAYCEVRNISHNLIPKELIENGLLGALMKLVEGINNSSKIVFQIKAKSEILTNNKNLIFELYNVILELTTNILKHSNASTAVLEINQLKDKIEIKVMDNGIGMSPNNFNGKGLNNIKERLKRINGVLNLTSDKTFKTIYSINIIEIQR